MRRSRWMIALLLVACLIVPQMSLAKDTAKAGSIVSFSGTVELKKGGGTKLFKAFKNMAFTQGDTLITGTKSSATLQLDEDKQVEVAASTKLVISELVKSVKAQGGKTSISLQNGKVKVSVNKKLDGDSRLTIKTPTSIMGVMGTQFYVHVTPDQTWIGVLEGEVRVRSNTGMEASVMPNQAMSIFEDGEMVSEELTQEMIDRFEEDGRSGDAEPEKQVIVYEPEDDGSDNGTVDEDDDSGPIVPSVIPPSVGSVPYYHPMSAMREALTIPFSTGSMNASLEEVKAVYYRNSFRGDKAVYSLDSTDYTVNGQLLELSEDFIESIPESYPQMELRLLFSSGHIVPVTLKPKVRVELNRQAFEQHFHEQYWTNQTIVIPFYTSVAHNPDMPMSLKEGIAIITNGEHSELGSNDIVTFGGVNNNELHIQLAQPLETNSQISVEIMEGMLVDPITGMVQQEMVNVFLPQLRFAIAPETVYYTVGSQTAQQVKFFPYQIPPGDLSLSATPYESNGDWLGYSIALNEGMHYTLQSVNGQQQLTLLPAYMDVIPSDAARTDVEIYLATGQIPILLATLNLKPMPTISDEWVAASLWNNQLVVDLMDDVLVQGVSNEHYGVLPRLAEQIWLTRDQRIVQPLYMLGETEYSHPFIQVILDSDEGLEGTMNQLYFSPNTWMMNSGLLLSNGMWSNGIEVSPNSNDPAQFLYTLIDLPVPIKLNPNEVISSVLMDTDSLTAQDYTLSTNVDGIQTIIFKQSYLQQLFSTSQGSDSRSFTFVISELNGGQLEVKEEVVIEVLYRNM